MRTLKILITALAIFILSIPGIVSAQSTVYHGAFENHFFGWMPSARMEAMGKGFVGVSGDPHSYFVNPGAMGTLEGLNLTAGFANPYYLLRDAKYNNFSASYNFENIGVIGISRDYSDWGKIEYYGQTGSIIESTPKNYNYRLTYSREITDEFYAGINLNLFGFDSDVFGLRTEGSSVLAGIGVLKRINIFDAPKGDIQMDASFGASLFNVTSSKLDLSNQKEVLPVIVRVGGSYQLGVSIPGTPWNSKFLNILYAIEYQNVLNGEDYDGVKTGLELTLFELLSLRGGFYSLGLRDQSACSNCKGKIQEVTYGAGINLPLKNLGITNIPAEFRFDLAVMPHPSQVNNPEDFDFGDYRVFNFSANVEF